MPYIRAIILDFDGVLAESNEEKTGAFRDLFALYPEYQQAMMDYHLARFSTSRMAKFEHYVYKLMDRPGDVESVQEMAKQFSNFVMHRVAVCPDVPGVREFLKEFSGRLPLYVSSATPQSELQEIVRLRGIDPYFVHVFGDPPIQKREAVGWILDTEKLPSSEVVFIGDSPSDFMVAKDCGLSFFGRDSGIPFDHVEIELYRDFYEIADIVRPRIKG